MHYKEMLSLLDQQERDIATHAESLANAFWHSQQGPCRCGFRLKDDLDDQLLQVMNTALVRSNLDLLAGAMRRLWVAPTPSTGRPSTIFLC